MEVKNHMVCPKEQQSIHGSWIMEFQSRSDGACGRRSKREPDHGGPVFQLKGFLLLTMGEEDKGFEHGSNMVTISENFLSLQNVGCIGNGKTGDRNNSREVVIVVQEI